MQFLKDTAVAARAVGQLGVLRSKAAYRYSAKRKGYPAATAVLVACLLCTSPAFANIIPADCGNKALAMEILKKYQAERAAQRTFRDRLIDEEQQALEMAQAAAEQCVQRIKDLIAALSMPTFGFDISKILAQLAAKACNAVLTKVAKKTNEIQTVIDKKTGAPINAINKSIDKATGTSGGLINGAGSNGILGMSGVNLPSAGSTVNRLSCAFSGTCGAAPAPTPAPPGG